MRKIFLIGSYNGQDSFGDKGLIRAVAAQFRHVLGREVSFVCHVHDMADEMRTLAEGVEFRPGFTTLFGPWFNKLRHLHLPQTLHLLVAMATFPLWCVVGVRNRARLRAVMRDIRASECMYFFGGTQLSEQWFDFNFPSVFWSALWARLSGKPVFFGPQQYGPESPRQRRWLRRTIRFLVTDIRARNINCLELIGLPQAKLALDEIYSCVASFPVDRPLERSREFILINMRSSNFLRDANTGEFRAFAELLAALQRRLGLPYKLFQMSGASFCDDTRLLEFLTPYQAGGLRVEVAPALEQENQLIQLAGRAYGTVSMSFHGCVLSMIGGCAAVPVTSGGYYDYKYVDFDRYAGGQPVPLIFLGHESAMEAAHRIASYFESYRPEVTMDARRRAGTQIEEWYREVAGHLKGKSPATAHS